MPDTYNFWKVFVKKYPEPIQQKQRIENLCECSNYWLFGNPSYQLGFIPVSLSYYSLPNISSDLAPIVKDYVDDAIHGAIGYVDRICDPDNCSRIEIIRQSPNVGICYSDALSDMAESYKRAKNANSKPLHITAKDEIFEDICI